MSKSRSRKSSTESPGGAEAAVGFNDDAQAAAGSDEFSAGASGREEAVEELDEALDSLPEDAGAGGPFEEEPNPLGRIDVSGETSFDSAEFEEEDEEDDEDDEDDEDGMDDLVTDDEASDDEKSEAVVVFDADAEDRAEEFERMRAAAGVGAAAAAAEGADDEIAPGGQPRELAELVSICEALIFVSEEPISVKALADLLGEDKGWVQVAVDELGKEFNERGGGLMLREVAGGWQFATRPEHHEHVRAYLKSKPSAKLSLAALETLAVIAYKQPVTVPEILEIRGVQSSSAIKTLLDKRLIVAKGRKETVGRPMMYGTSKDFLLQFGLKDLSELPNVEDFEDMAGGGEV